MSLTELRLAARDTCPACDGGAGALSEEWQEFNEWASQRGFTDQALEDAVEDYFLGVRDFTSVPPMRDPCETCNGDGTIDVELRVDKLLELVAEFVRGPLIPAGELDEVVDTLKKAMTSAALKSQGLADPLDVGSWLRACTEAAEALRAVGELRSHRRDV